jgi:mRNA-degrading endonuclease RelE of RelBE toxin-antitoxin system
MPSDSSSIQIDLTPEYKRNLRDLAKRYRNICSDTQTVIEQLEAGNFIGDRLSGLGTDYIVYKVRVRNSNIQKGKSAGYCLIYQVDSPTSLLLLTIYTKADRDDISHKEIMKILAEFFCVSNGGRNGDRNAKFRILYLESHPCKRQF